MTQPQIIDVAPDPADQRKAEREHESRTITSEQLASKIMEEADLSSDEMETLRRATRLGGWEVGKTLPSFPSHVIDSMFTGSNGDRTDDFVAGDTRVYARPLSLTDPQGNLWPFYRIVVNRTPGTQNRLDSLNLFSFIEDVAFEYKAMLVDEDDEEEEEEVECQNCMEDLEPTDKFCCACGHAVRKCLMCSTALDPGQKFCGACGVPVPPPGMAR